MNFWFVSNLFMLVCFAIFFSTLVPRGDGFSRAGCRRGCSFKAKTKKMERTNSWKKLPRLSDTFS